MHHPYPPPTDGPNTRFRISQGLPPVSGNTAPYPSPSASATSPHPYEQYEERERQERAREENKSYIMSYAEWKEWRDVTRGAHGAANDSPVAAQNYTPLDHLAYSQPVPSPTTSYVAPHSASSQTLYYAIDPSLPFDPPSSTTSEFYYSTSDYAPVPHAPSSASYSESFYPYSEPAWSPPAPPSAHHERDRIVSSASIIDHGPSPSPEPEPEPDVFASQPLPPLAAPVRSMTKEEWLRMGGFTDEPSPAPTYTFPPNVQSYQLPPLPTAESFLFQPPPPPLPRPTPTRPRTTGGTSIKSAPSPSPVKKRRTAPYPSSSSSEAPPPRPPPVPSSFSTFESIPLPNLPISLPPQSLSRKSHSRKRSASHIPRPRNSFMLFRSHAYNSGMIPKDVGLTDHKNISKVVGDIWRRLGPEGKKVWDLLAETEKREHRERYPDYKFQPKQKPRAPKPEVVKEESDGDSVMAVTRPKPKRGRAPKKPVASDLEADPPAIRQSSRIRTRPLNDSYAYSEDIEVDDADSDEIEEQTTDATSDMAAGMSSWAGPAPPAAPWSSKVENQFPKVEWTQARVEAVAQAVIDGVPGDELKQRVEEDLARSQGPLPSLTPDFGSLPAMSPTPPDALATSSWPSTTQAASATMQATPAKARSSLHQRHKSDSPSKMSPASLHRSPASDTTVSPPFKHSRLARRKSAQTARSTSPASGSDSPQRMGMSPSGKHPLSRSYPPPRDISPPHPAFSPPTDEPPPVTKESTYQSLGLAHPSPDGPRSPFVHPSTAFDNSPLLGSGPDRRFSLGRWELRKPSAVRHVSRRELAAQEEEERAGEVQPSLFDGLAPTFAAGIDEFEEGFHAGEVDLFAAPEPVRAILGSAGPAVQEGEEADDEASTSYGGSSAFRF